MEERLKKNCIVNESNDWFIPPPIPKGSMKIYTIATDGPIEAATERQDERAFEVGEQAIAARVGKASSAYEKSAALTRANV